MSVLFRMGTAQLCEISDEEGIEGDVVERAWYFTVDYGDGPVSVGRYWDTPGEAFDALLKWASDRGIAVPLHALTLSLLGTKPQHSRWYILIAEGGGWPTHAIGPFESESEANAHLEADKWRSSWGSVTDDPRNLVVIPPEP